MANHLIAGLALPANGIVAASRPSCLYGAALVSEALPAGHERQEMPSLFRFLVVVGLLAGLAYGAVISLANFVPLHPREIVVTVPPANFIKQD